jgi:hypothetical protein
VLFVFLGAFAVVVPFVSLLVRGRVLFVFLGALAVFVLLVSVQLGTASVSLCRLVCFVCFVAI